MSQDPAKETPYQKLTRMFSSQPPTTTQPMNSGFAAAAVQQQPMSQEPAKEPSTLNSMLSAPGRSLTRLMSKPVNEKSAQLSLVRCSDYGPVVLWTTVSKDIASHQQCKGTASARTYNLHWD